jgi:hypothetical protein
MCVTRASYPWYMVKTKVHMHSLSGVGGILFGAFRIWSYIREKFKNMSEESCFYVTDSTTANTEGHVYVLKLEGGKFYVGYSREVETRIASHFLGLGAKFTQKYKPLEVVSVKSGDLLLENVTTIALMAVHGWDEVRGGKYCKLAMQSPPASLAKALKYVKQADP